MATSASFIGHGLYGVAEASRLVGVTVDMILRWTSPNEKRTALLQPQLDPFFSFHDLLTLQLVRQLSERKVPLVVIANGMTYLRSELGVERPFAHRRFATVGKSWFAKGTESHLDIGQQGQLAWPDFIGPTLETLTYAADGMGAARRPGDRVCLDPQIQAGAACIDGSRTTTRFVWNLLEAVEAVDDIAWEFELKPADLAAARDFERLLDERRPLQLAVA